MSTRSAANLGLEYCSGSVQGIAGEQHALDALTIPAPLLDLVEIAMVRDPRRRRRNRATVAGRAQQRDDHDAGDQQARRQGVSSNGALNEAFPSCLTEKFKRGLNKILSLNSVLLGRLLFYLTPCIPRF